MDPDLLVANHPTIYHMAEDGTWPSIVERGLLSTKAIVVLYHPDETTRHAVLGQARKQSITLANPRLGSITIRDQRPLKFLEQRLTKGTTVQEFLDALNGRVFFWLNEPRLRTLLNARAYRHKKQTVLHVDTKRLLERYRDHIQLAPYNTGSIHVPNMPRRGPEVFVDLLDYPYEKWQKRRGRSGDAVVELTIPYAVPDVSNYVTRVETWDQGDVTGSLSIA